MLRRIIRSIADVLNRVVADRPSKAGPGANYIPDSNGEGGKVIATGAGSRR